MNHFRVIINYFGDLSSLELAIGEMLSSLPTTELDFVEIEIRNEGIVDDA